jgi:hypothetical protein
MEDDAGLRLVDQRDLYPGIAARDMDPIDLDEPRERTADNPPLIELSKPSLRTQRRPASVIPLESCPHGALAALSWQPYWPGWLEKVPHCDDNWR